jgi:hypothetical protein
MVQKNLAFVQFMGIHYPTDVTAVAYYTHKVPKSHPVSASATIVYLDNKGWMVTNYYSRGYFAEDVAIMIQFE